MGSPAGLPKIPLKADDRTICNGGGRCGIAYFAAGICEDIAVHEKADDVLNDIARNVDNVEGLIRVTAATSGQLNLRTWKEVTLGRLRRLGEGRRGRVASVTHNESLQHLALLRDKAARIGRVHAKALTESAALLPYFIHDGGTVEDACAARHQQNLDA